MELEPIFWGRLRVLQTRTTSLEGRVSTLEDRSIASSQRSEDRWSQLKWWADVAPRLGGLLRVLYQTWPLILAAAAAVWTLVLPGLRWLWRLLSSGLAWLSGLGLG